MIIGKIAGDSECSEAPPHMKVLMVSGSWPPEPCGVGDYASRLSDALEDVGIDLLRFGGKQALRMRNLHQSLGQVRNLEADIIHLQYPTMAYGRSFAPPLFAMLAEVPVVVTLHKFDGFRFYRIHQAQADAAINGRFDRGVVEIGGGASHRALVVLH